MVIYFAPTLYSLRTSNNLCDLLRDACLTCPVVMQIQLLDHFLGIVGRSLHGGTSCSQLTGYTLTNRTIDQTSQILGTMASNTSDASGSYRIRFRMLFVSCLSVGPSEAAPVSPMAAGKAWKQTLCNKDQCVQILPS